MVRSRRIAVILMLVAVAGCGDDGKRTNSKPLGGGLGLEIESEPAPPVSGKAVTWIVTAENNGVEAVELTFGSSQRAEVVLRRDGKEAYRWSSGRFFSAAVSDERLLPNRKLRFELPSRPLKARPGKYDLIVRLTAKPEQEPLRRTIEID